MQPGNRLACHRQPQQIDHADHADQPAEIFYPAMTQVHLTINVRQHGVDRTLVGLGNAFENSPVDLLQEQTGGKAVEAYRP